MSPEVEGALALLDTRNGGRGRGSIYMAITDALRRRLETVISATRPETRATLLEATWTFSCLPDFRSVTAILLETWPGGFPRELAEAIHSWPEDAFMKLPSIVRWKFKSACASLVTPKF